jgi:glycosyltransferase involved in cell wall biosynthesis
MYPSIGFLILTYNRLGIVLRCFRSLADTLNRENVRWYILDNGSKDGTAEFVLNLSRQYPGKVIAELHADNTGVAGGRARLLELAAHEEIQIILDSDVEAVAPDWLDHLIAPLQAREDIWVCGPGGAWVNQWWRDFDSAPGDYVGETDVISGYCQAWKRVAFQAGVSMDLFYNPRWHEDSDCCLQSRTLGGKVWDTGEIGLHHMFSHTGDDGSSIWKMIHMESKFKGRGIIRAEWGIK